MKLNDPFGRMARRRETEYEAMKSSLYKNGINTPAKARKLLRDSRERIYKTAGVVGVVCIPLIVAFPKAFLVNLSLTLLILVMCFKALAGGKGHIERYIEEELSGKTDEEA